MKIETKKGIWVSNTFTEKFGNKDIKPSKKVPEFKTLERNMCDSEILSEFDVQGCTLSDVAAFLKNPPKGYDDGYQNLFYFPGCVVSVRWCGDDREWDVDARGLVDVHWLAGCRAFSSNWRSDTKDSSTLTLKSLDTRVGKMERMLAKVLSDELISEV